MTDPSDAPRGPAPLPIEGADRRGPRLSIVWLIPVFAVAAALWVAYQNYAERGPLIEVAFSQATGVRAGETELRYRDISVGVVEQVGFSSDLSQVVASIRVDQAVAAFIDADAVFWIVSPEVTAQGVTGLETVLSGVYINGVWDQEAGAAESRFVGADTPPLLTVGETGITFVLRSETGLPPEGTPILYRGVEVGTIGTSDITESGLYVEAPAVVRDPYASLVSSATRFWDVSGFGFSLDARGASLDFNSIASLIAGGVTFDTMGSGGQGVAEQTVFTLYTSEDRARDDFFTEAEGGEVDVQMVFEDNIPGLQPGADIRLGGIRLGEVVSITGLVDADRFGDNAARLLATARLNPGRVGINAEEDAADFLDFLDRRIAEGLRARLTNASILTGGLMIELVDAGGTPAALDRSGDPYPVFPTVSPRVTNLTATAQGLLARVDALPVEDLIDSVIATLDGIQGVVASDAIQEAPEALLETLAAVRDLLASEELQEAPAALMAALEALRDLLQSEALQKTPETLLATLDAVQSVASSDALQQTPDSLLATLEALREIVESEPVQQAPDALIATLDALRDVLQSEAIQAAPDALLGALEAVRALIENEDLAGLPAQLSRLTGELEQAAAGVNALLQDVQQSALLADLEAVVAALGETADRLPGLADQAGRVLSEAEALSLDALAEDARGFLASVDALLSQPSTQGLPAEVNAALSALRETLDALREGGVVDNTNATLAAARQAAEAVSEASQALPRLSRDLSVAARQANVTLSDFGRGSEFGRELSDVLRQIEAAAVAIDRLARQIARNPSSLLTGR